MLAGGGEGLTGVEIINLPAPRQAAVRHARV